MQGNAEVARAPGWFVEAIEHPTESHRVRVSGSEIHYRSWGIIDGRPGLLFVHGYLGNSHWWDHIAPFFADRWNVYAMDLSGMGQSDRRQQYSHQQNAEDVLAVIDDAGISPATVVAHSYGGVPSSFACHARPEAFKHFVLLDSRVPLPGVMRYANRQAFENKYYPDYETALGRFRLMPPGGWPVDFVSDHIAKHSYYETPQGIVSTADGGVGGMFTEPMPLIDGHEVHTPVDYIFGDRSEVVSSEQVELIVSQFARANDPIVIPACHHHLMVEQPIALVMALRCVLDRKA